MLSLEAIRRYSSQKGRKITEDFPFDEETLVLKVAGKSFLFTDITQDPVRINLKCDPDRALDLRSKYDAVLPGYHMNKKHWNTVILDGSIPDNEIMDMIDHSYDLVVGGLTKSRRAGVEGRRLVPKKKKPASGGHSRGKKR